jgi:hypothetical protein
MTSIDPNFPGIFEGAVDSVTVTDPAPYPGQVGNMVIDPAASFTLEVTWHIDGPFAPIVLAAMAPSWDLRVFAESQGPGAEPRLVNVSVPTSSGTTVGTRTTWTYAATITPPHLADGTVNKLVVVVRDTLPGPLDLAGYIEGPIVLMESGN